MGSANSSKPPASDGLKKTPQNREKKPNRRGGQRGHKGKTLKHVKNKKVISVAENCQECGAHLKNVEVSKTQKRQVMDIEIKRNVTQAHTKICTCG